MSCQRCEGWSSVATQGEGTGRTLRVVGAADPAEALALRQHHAAPDDDLVAPAAVQLRLDQVHILGVARRVPAHDRPWSVAIGQRGRTELRCADESARTRGRRRNLSGASPPSSGAGPASSSAAASPSPYPRQQSDQSHADHRIMSGWPGALPAYICSAVPPPPRLTDSDWLMCRPLNIIMRMHLQ